MLGLVVSGDGSAPILLTDRLVEEDSSYIDSFWKLLMNFDLASRAGAWRRWDADDHLGLYKDLCSPFFCRTSPMVHVCVWVFFCMNFGTKTGGLFKSIDWHPSISRPMYAIAFLLLSVRTLRITTFGGYHGLSIDTPILGPWYVSPYQRWCETMVDHVPCLAHLTPF